MAPYTGEIAVGELFISYISHLFIITFFIISPFYYYIFLLSHLFTPVAPYTGAAPPSFRSHPPPHGPPSLIFPPLHPPLSHFSFFLSFSVSFLLHLFRLLIRTGIARPGVDEGDLSPPPPLTRCLTVALSLMIPSSLPGSPSSSSGPPMLYQSYFSLPPVGGHTSLSPPPPPLSISHFLLFPPLTWWPLDSTFSRSNN